MAWSNWSPNCASACRDSDPAVSSVCRRSALPGASRYPCRGQGGSNDERCTAAPEQPRQDLRASRVLLYAIEGALLDIPWSELHSDQKEALNRAFERLQTPRDSSASDSEQRKPTIRHFPP